MSKYLVVVDMQNDFIDMALGTPEAVAIVPAVKNRIEEALAAGEKVLFTQDTHYADYLSTQEGRNLPVEHCIEGTVGWEIAPLLETYSRNSPVFKKNTFGSTELADYLVKADRQEKIEEITLVGLCTDICVISNAMLIKASLPEVKISVERNCCAGVTPESHDNALSAMSTCQISVIK